jgi:hypothetical protein
MDSSRNVLTSSSCNWSFRNDFMPAAKSIAIYAVARS